MAEVFNMLEARLAIAQASASGDNWMTAWKTASGVNASTAIIAYVRSLDITSANTQYPVMGGMGANYVAHFKNAGNQPITINLTLEYTGNLPTFTAFNASQPYAMLELMQKQVGTSASAYWHFIGVPWVPSEQFTVNANANTITLQLQAAVLAKPTTGYIMV